MSPLRWVGVGVGVRVRVGVSSSRVTVALGEASALRWQRPPKAFSVSARLKPASA